MDFYHKHNLDYNKFRMVLSCWRGDSAWRFLQEGYPALIKPKLKSKTELRILHRGELLSNPILVDSGTKKLRIRVDQYESDWLDKGATD